MIDVLPAAYHISYDLELKFDGLADAEAYARSRPVFMPAVPWTAMNGEDRTVPRICVAPTLEGCISAIKPQGAFRRCLNANPDAKSYENDGEAYPVLIAEFHGVRCEAPSAAQVPDVGTTGERWILDPARPDLIRVAWLDAYSIGIKDDDPSGNVICTSVRLLEDPSGYSHPWLDGRGHPLDSSEMGGDPWPDPFDAEACLWYDMHFGGVMGYAYPEYPFAGRFHFIPLDPSIRPYMTFRNKLRRYSGFKDESGRPMLEDYLCEYHGVTGELRFAGSVCWLFEPLDGSPARVFRDGDAGPDGRVPGLKALAYEALRPGFPIK